MFLDLCIKVNEEASSAYNAPMNAPILVPPTMSIGIPVSVCKNNRKAQKKLKCEKVNKVFNSSMHKYTPLRGF